MEEMKNLEIIDRTGKKRNIQYKHIEVCRNDDWYKFTEFYEGTFIKTHKKYFFFGETISTDAPKKIFTIREDYENPQLSKEWWNTTVMSKLHEYDQLNNRIQEIENGIVL